MSRGDARLQFLYELPASVLCEFCRVMDGLSDLDWTRFASEVLVDQVNVRLSERQERRTNYVMSQWGNRNGRVGELLDLLEHLQLLRPRDIILRWSSSLTPPPPPPVPAAPLRPSPPDTLSRFDPPPKTVVAMTSAKVDKGGEGGGSLPRPAPPPSSLQSSQPGPPQGPTLVACGDGGRGVMCWSYEEVYAGTEGFSPALQVGEGGFGVVYRASLRNTDCAVKRLKQDCLQDFAMLKESFNTEVEKLSKFRHPNIVDLLGFCEGPGGVCLIYSYMENRSLEDRLHSVSGALRWSLRVSIVVEVSTALQFLHYPPEGQNSVIHGDVKSSNILLDRHLVAKLADFGLARFVYPSSSRRSASKTTSLGHTTTVRGTLAYLPEEYVRNGQLGTTVDVYSFGVVLLEVLTGRRALEKDKKSGDIYLKDLVKEVQEGPAGSCAVAWRQQLDRRLIIGGATEPAGSMQMAALACECLDRKCKKRPVMTEVFDKLQDIHKLVRKSDIALLPAPTLSSDCNVEVLSQQVSGLGPLEDTYKPPSYLPPPLSMFSSSSLCASLSSLPPPSTSLHPPSSSSFEGPCETDESRGFSQYDVSTGSHGRSKTLSPPTRNQYHSQTRSNESWSREPSKDQYNVHVHPSNAANRTGPCLSPSGPQMGMVSRQGPRGQTIEKCFSPAGPLQSVCPQSSDAVRHCEASRGPEESDELDYLADS